LEEVGDDEGIEFAQAVGGHESLKSTAIYARKRLKRAIKIAKKRG
jgi:hypothetical protein